MTSALISVVLLLGSGSASAADAASTEVHDYVQSRKDAIYLDVIADYEQAVRDNPGDVVVALRHCDAIQFFAYSEDLYREDAATEAEACGEEVRKQYPGHIEVLLRDLQ
ncbi:MAG: hypothetical protein AAGE85_16585, partial [Pseudomonadota bacterium]